MGGCLLIIVLSGIVLAIAGILAHYEISTATAGIVFFKIIVVLVGLAFVWVVLSALSDLVTGRGDGGKLETDEERRHREIIDEIRKRK